MLSRVRDTKLLMKTILLKIGRERAIGFEALSVSYMPKGDYVIVGGCNRQCILMSGEGVKLGMIGEEQESWIWSCKPHPVAPFVVSSLFHCSLIHS